MGYDLEREEDIFFWQGTPNEIYVGVGSFQEMK
jgi:hypothetical protein